MRVLVCGGRDFGDYEWLERWLDSFSRRNTITTVIHGGAPGVDSLASRWARERFIPIEVFRADWAGYGKAAGPMRNARMLREGKPDLVVAFPGGRGTKNMTMQASNAGVKVVHIPAREREERA